MSFLETGSGEGIYYEFESPSAGQPTLVFVNALTGSIDNWSPVVEPALHEAGLGVLRYNFKGQPKSPVNNERALDDQLIVRDLCQLTEAVRPPRPVYCGLSIGGLFAARAVLAGCPAEGLVLLNTLRRIGTRLDWVNRAGARAVALGGTRLIGDLFMPLICGEAMLNTQRENFLLEDPYESPDPLDGHRRLMIGAISADWNVPWSKLDLPTLVISGLYDRVFFESDVVDELFAELPKGQRQDWSDAGHLLTADQPQRLAQSLIEFTRSL
jgi:pimeloyl-ACP methyl ester carboxylesterase